MRKEYLRETYLEQDTHLNEYAAFVQALRLDVWSVSSHSLIRFAGPPSCAACFVMSHQRWNAKVLEKKNWRQVTDLISDWNEKLKICIWKKKKVSLCSSVPSCPLFSAQKKNPLLYLFVEERWCIGLFWSLCLFETGILWDVIHKCFTAHHFLRSCRVYLCDYGCEEKLWGWAHCRAGKDAPSVLSLEPQAEFIPVHAESVCLFHFAKQFFPPI